MENLGRPDTQPEAPGPGASRRGGELREAVEGGDKGDWRGVRVLVTGHTGFKGSWLTLWLSALGAEVHGLSLAPPEGPSHYSISAIDACCDSHIADIRDRDAVARIVSEARPEMVFHLAAQALVLEGVRDPVGTFETNVLGTMNVLDALRRVEAVAGILVVTSDKVYRNDGAGRRFQEGDPLGGVDPYSASKAACEHVVSSYRETWFKKRGVAVASARAGNVIGGGDFGADRLAPDCVRAAINGDRLLLRDPQSTRPWQHVFDCLEGYLRYAELLCGADGLDAPFSMNFGSCADEAMSAEVLSKRLMAALGRDESFVDAVGAPRSVEISSLAIDSSLSRRVLGFEPRFDLSAAIEQTAEWTAAWRNGDNMAVHGLRDLARRYETVDGAASSFG